MNNSLAEERQSANTSSFQRIPSESSLLSTVNGEIYSQHMPSFPWQRSQSALDLDNRETSGGHAAVGTVEYSNANQATGEYTIVHVHVCISNILSFLPSLGPLKCYVTFFCWKFDIHHPLVTLITFIAFFQKI